MQLLFRPILRMLVHMRQGAYVWLGGLGCVGIVM